MSRSGWSASNYLSLGSALKTATPLSISAWVYPTTNNVVQTIVQIAGTGTTDDRFLIRFENWNVLQAVAASSATNAATSASSFNVNSWNHVAGTFTSSTARACYLNNVAATGTSSATPNAANLTRTYIGVSNTTSGLTSAPFNGRIAEVGVWGAALTADEIASLYAGVSPLLVRPASLLAYVPLVGTASPETNLVASPGFTINGSLSQDAHPAVIAPRTAQAVV